jgi:hypothetical protein
MWPDIWRHTVRNDYVVKDAQVSGFKIRKVKKENYPAIIRSHSDEDSNKQDIVKGKVYFDINPQDFIRVQEHIGIHFDIIDGVCFTADSDIPISSKIFLWKTEHRTLLSSEEWTKEWFEEKALGHYRKEMNQSLF